jgi:hypothetical protein
MADKLILIVSLPPSRSGSRLIETDPTGLSALQIDVPKAAISVR